MAGPLGERGEAGGRGARRPAVEGAGLDQLGAGEAAEKRGGEGPGARGSSIESELRADF